MHPVRTRSLPTFFLHRFQLIIRDAVFSRSFSDNVYGVFRPLLFTGPAWYQVSNRSASIRDGETLAPFNPSQDFGKLGFCVVGSDFRCQCDIS